MKNIFKIEIDENRIFGLDLLRTLAISFVVIEHGYLLLPEQLKPTNILAFDGVTLFFVLSGYLIGGILIKSIAKSGISIRVIKNFWIRRWFRTLPTYFLILIILCILHFFSNKGFTLGSVSRYFYFSQNIFTQHPGFFLVAWSLSVEEWFYLLLPILLSIFIVIFSKSLNKAILYTCIFVIVQVLVFRYYRYLTIPLETFNDWDLIFGKQVVTRIDSLMFGVLGAYIKFFYNRTWIKYKNQLVVFGIILFVISKWLTPTFTHFTDIFACVFSFDLKSISILFVLPFLSEMKTTKNTYLYKGVTYISLTSYSIYLLHFSIVCRFLMINSLPWYIISDNELIIALLKYSIYLVLVILLSILLYKYFEIPMTSLRDRKIFKRKKYNQM